MAQPRRKPVVEPRGWTLAEVATFLGHGPNWLSPLRLAQLQAEGFPKVDPLLERVDCEAVRAWLDARSGLALDDGAAAPAPFRPNPWRKAIEDGDKAALRRRHS